MLVEVLVELLLGLARTCDQPGVDVLELGQDLFEESAVVADVAAADLVGLVMDLAMRRVGLDALALDVVGCDQENLGLAMIEPDHGVGRGMRHGGPPMLSGGNAAASPNVATVCGGRGSSCRRWAS